MNWRPHRNWSQRAERGLCRTFGHDREAIIAGVNQGSLQLWEIDDGKAWMVTRAQFGVLTVCCLQGCGLAELAPLIYRIAQTNDLHAIEFFTRRPGLARMLKAYGFTPQETIYRCEVRRELVQ